MRNSKWLFLILILICSKPTFGQIDLESDEINDRIDNEKFIPSVEGKVLLTPFVAV